MCAARPRQVSIWLRALELGHWFSVLALACRAIFSRQSPRIFTCLALLLFFPEYVAACIHVAQHSLTWERAKRARPAFHSARFACYAPSISSCAVWSLLTAPIATHQTNRPSFFFSAESGFAVHSKGGKQHAFAVRRAWLRELSELKVRTRGWRGHTQGIFHGNFVRFL